MPSKKKLHRAHAEDKLSHTPALKASVIQGDELLHELHVHKIELEMQNEELRRTLIALEKSRDRYMKLYDFAPVGYLTLTSEGLITEINLMGAKLLGEQHQKLINRHFISLVAPTDCDRWHRLFMELIRNAKEVNDFELMLQRSDKFLFYAQLNCQRVEADHQATKVYLTLIDITERKQTEAALNERDRELQLIMNATPALMSYLDIDFRYLRVNTTYEHWVGHTSDSLRGRHVKEVVGATAWHIIQPYLERVLTGETVAFDQQIPYGGGNARWVHASYIPNKDLLGTVKGIVVHVVDIEDRKLAEMERQKFVSLADNSLEFIGMCDMNFMPFYANAAAMRLVGLDTLEQTFQTPVQDFFFPEDQRFILEEFFPLVLRNGRGEIEIRFRHFQTGEAVWMIYNVFNIKNENGDPVGLATVSRDITSRKLAEAALLESEEQLRQAKNATGMGVYDHDLISGTMRWDDRVRELWGVISDETITLTTFMKRLHALDRESVKAAVALSFDSKGSGEYYAEYRIVRPTDNRLFWVRAFGNTTFANGRPIRLVGMVQDITARKQIEVALQESDRQNQFLATILENVDQPFCTGFSNGRLEYMNRAYEQLLGYSCAELQVKNWVTELTPIEWREVEQAKLEELYCNHQAVRYEKEYVRKDGTRVPIEMLVELVSTDTDQPIRYCAFVTDLTERKIAQAALHENEARLNLALKAANAGLWDRNLVTGTVYFSPEWKGQIGYADEELQNNWDEWINRLHPEDRQAVLVSNENFLTGQLQQYELEFRLLHKDKVYRWIHARGALLRDQNGLPERMLGINLDITELKKSQELHLRRTQMEDVLRLQIATQTAAAIAHELNQPLTAISSYAEVALALLEIGNQNPQKLSHTLENCALQAQRAGDVIRQLMTVLHKGETISEPIAINNLVLDAINFVKADKHLGTFKIKHDFAVDLPPVVANALQIQKVLVNLLYNGMESLMESGIDSGTMTVTTRNFASNASMAHITVCDSGKGLADSANVKAIFQPFYTTKATGLGMGLSISRALIDAHGGKMWAEQNPDRGMSIHFTLPYEI